MMIDSEAADVERARESDSLAQQLIDGANRPGVDTYTKTLLWHASSLIDRLTQERDTLIEGIPAVAEAARREERELLPCGHVKANIGDTGLCEACQDIAAIRNGERELRALDEAVVEAVRTEDLAEVPNDEIYRLRDFASEDDDVPVKARTLFKMCVELELRRHDAAKVRRTLAARDAAIRARR